MREFAQRLFSCGAIAIGVWACSADPSVSPAGADDETEDASTADEKSERPTSRHDASAASLAEAGSGQSAAHDASGVTSGASSSGDSAGEGMTSMTQFDRDASIIIEPEVEALAIAELCQRIGSLEGESVDVDLTAELETSDWIAVAPASADAAADSAADAMVCEERFAAFVVRCNASLLVITAPTFAFGEGPLVGGEQVGFGCWESACDAGCLPQSVEGIGRVRVRVTAPVNPRYDEERAVTVGEIRVNGVDVAGIAQLEILERL